MISLMNVLLRIGHLPYYFLKAVISTETLTVLGSLPREPLMFVLDLFNDASFSLLSIAGIAEDDFIRFRNSSAVLG